MIYPLPDAVIPGSDAACLWRGGSAGEGGAAPAEAAATEAPRAVWQQEMVSVEWRSCARVLELAGMPSRLPLPPPSSLSHLPRFRSAGGEQAPLFTQQAASPLLRDCLLLLPSACTPCLLLLFACPSPCCCTSFCCRGGQALLREHAVARLPPLCKSALCPSAAARLPPVLHVDVRGRELCKAASTERSQRGRHAFGTHG